MSENVTLDRFRRQFWKQNPDRLKEAGERYWLNPNKAGERDRRKVHSYGFFTETRLRNLSEHFNTLEDTIKLGVNMFYDSEVLWSLEKKFYKNISKMALTLFVNYIYNRHEGDEKTVNKLVVIFFNISKTQCAEKIKKEFKLWSQIDVGKIYKNLDEEEQKWKQRFSTKQEKVFGWENKQTPERFFDYIGTFYSLKETNKGNLVGFNESELNNMIGTLLNEAPIKFAFQYLPSGTYYKYDDSLVEKLTVVSVGEKKMPEKLLWKIAETDLEWKMFKAKFEDIVLEDIRGEYITKQENYSKAYYRSLFMKAFKCLVYMSTKINNDDKFRELINDDEHFKRRIKKFEADCKQSYVIKH